ncbi:uncharacterized protein TM35_000091600 [Trypanosoma theileri]|uniref:Exonuclease domain-containing protein n=1 Tax=Trypanosoma theileri TaxID=67003 RepID=A0A1X0P115_9TRYP|nr:uncharacterized protein TM35_000091600 [Trypanosoma theileri]ORC90110.1 hypothetical protein TM35_000091600 [Trypanosoma theileri]
MSGHTKRAMAQKKANKERRACLHGQRVSTHQRKKPQQRSQQQQQQQQQQYQHHRQGTRPHNGIYDDVDPLDRQLFDYIIVVDVEATCERDTNNYPHEIIELPGVLIDVRRGVVDRQRSFRSYVRPTRHPILTDFCKSLTGISQEDVDKAPTLQEVVQAFESWFRATIPAGAKVAFAADGPWDFKNFIYEHAIVRDHVSFPSLFYEYLDIRTTFAHHFNRGAPLKLDAMLNRMKLRFEGRPHCGFDDAVNIARLAIAMMRAGCVFDYLVAIPLDDSFHYSMDGFPLYRREEGSGKLDADVVNDIAKGCYGMDFFTFGEQHREKVLQYRSEHPREFRHAALKYMDERFHRGRLTAVRSRLMALFVLAMIAVAMILQLLYTRLTKGWLLR